MLIKNIDDVKIVIKKTITLKLLIKIKFEAMKNIKLQNTT